MRKKDRLPVMAALVALAVFCLAATAGAGCVYGVRDNDQNCQNGCQVQRNDCEGYAYSTAQSCANGCESGNQDCIDSCESSYQIELDQCARVEESCVQNCMSTAQYEEQQCMEQYNRSAGICQDEYYDCQSSQGYACQEKYEKCINEAQSEWME